MRNSIRQIFQSALICLVCISFLTGSTYAWVTSLENDIATKTENGVTIYAIKPQLSWTDDLDSEWKSTVNPATSAVFRYDKWEPGYMQVRYVRLENGNEFPLKYVLNIEKQINRAPDADLARVIDVYFIPVQEGQSLTEITSREQIKELEPAGTLAELMLDEDGAAYGILAAKSGNKYGKVEAAIVLHMREEAGNEYQDAYVGNNRNDGFNLSIRFDDYRTAGATY